MNKEQFDPSFGIFNSKRFSAHFADDWLHVSVRGVMTSFFFPGKEKLLFTQFLDNNYSLEYETPSGLKISVEKNDDGFFEIWFNSKNTITLLLLKNEKQLKKLKDRLSQGISRYFVSSDAIYFYVNSKISDRIFGPFGTKEEADLKCKKMNNLTEDK